MNKNVCPSPHPDTWSGLFDILASQMNPDQLAFTVRRLFWNVHERDPELARDTLRDISVDWDERYGWLGGTDRE
jgi:hypothetical protein